MDESNGAAEPAAVDEAPRSSWVVRTLYVGLVAANLYLAFDWWRDTESGSATLARWAERIEAARAKAEGCEGCARRKARLQAMIHRVHWDADRIVEGEDVPTVPEPPAS